MRLVNYKNRIPAALLMMCIGARAHDGILKMNIRRID